jgi:putative ubiquitin-RnfH superfamily antitoxin RatB of RatAB toxin-antitoxin module
MATALIRVEVIYALPDGYRSIELELPESSPVEAAVRATRSRWPDVPIDDQRLAVFGRTVTLSSMLRDRDRLEILRPLIADPKQARRERAAERK